MVNKVILIGRLGKDPVVKHFSDTNAIADFSLATNESYKDKDGNWKDITEWHNIKLPNKYMAERAERQLKKGSLAFVEGKIRTRSYDDKDGNKKYITEIVAEQFRSLDGKKEGGGDGGGSSYSSGSNSYSQSDERPASTSSAADDDLPF